MIQKSIIHPKHLAIIYELVEMSREWLALVEMGKENEKFSPSLFLSTKLQPLAVTASTHWASFFV